MAIKAAVLLLAVFAVSTVTVTQARMMRYSDSDDDDGQWFNDRRGSRNGDNDRDDRMPSNKDNRTTTNPGDIQGGWPSDSNTHTTRKTSNAQGGWPNHRNYSGNGRTQTTPSYYPPRSGSGGDGSNGDKVSTKARLMYNQTKSCYFVDLAFAIDTSGRIAKENLTHVTNFINRFVGGMNVSKDCARVGIVTFGSAATLQFDLLVYTDDASLHRGIGRLDVFNQTRNFADAIKLVRSDVFQDYYGDRQDAPNVCMLITDGNSGDDRQYTLREVARAKADGISMHTVGIGRYVSMSELSAIADNPASAIYLNDLSELSGDRANRSLFANMQALKRRTAPRTSPIRNGTHQYTTPQRRASSNGTVHANRSTRPMPRTTTTTTQQPRTTNAVATNIDWRCSFEDATGRRSLCDMTQSSFDDFDWTLKSGNTPSSETGPNSAYGGSGYYVFIEASSPRRMNDKAMIMLPSFRQDGVYCLSFYYNMNGFHINKLQVVKRTTSGQLVNVWMKRHHQGSQWHAAHVTANLYGDDQLAFIGTRGREYSGDIAIDNISVRSGRCQTDDRDDHHD